MALCAGAEAAVAVTADRGDIAEPSAPVPGTRVVVRDLHGR